MPAFHDLFPFLSGISAASEEEEKNNACLKRCCFGLG